jgi:predicted nucleic acid-binding protein
MPDEQTSEFLQSLIERHVVKDIAIIGPKLLPFEVANTLRVGILRKRISLTKAKELMREFMDLEIELFDTDFMSAISAANRHNLSVYDASYLELAKSRKSKLVSFDERLMELAN